MIANETTLHKRPNDTEFTTIGHCMAFNNEQSPYRIVCHKMPEMTNVKQFKLKN